MPIQHYLAILVQPGSISRFWVARDIHRRAIDRLRKQHRWRNGVYALDPSTGTAIVFARGVGGDILELHSAATDDRPTVATPIDLGSLTRLTSSKLLSILLCITDTSSTMELHEYDYPTGTVGELVSGPPAR